MKLAWFLAAAMLLTGCASGASNPTTNTESSQTPSESPKVEQSETPVAEEEPNEWVRACNRYEPVEAVGYLEAYDQVIQDVCARYKTSTREIPYLLSENVDVEDAMRFIDSEIFHEGYWSNFISADFPAKERVVFSELDQKWFEEQMTARLIEPELGWFTSTTEGWHCRVEPTIFCPKFYEPKLTTTGVPVEFRIIGSRFSWQDWNIVNGAHESVHLYQDANGMSHWTYWYVEGQATFYELAMSRLLFGNDNLRENLVVSNVARQDLLQIDATSVETVLDFLAKCERTRQGECDTFKYGGGSLFHEKLVIDYGFERYLEWQQYLIENMPKGNPGEFSSAETERMIQTFNQSFVDLFGISKSDWERDVLAPYLVEIY